MSNQPDISVVVASFCGEATLARCLGRITDQAGDGVEIIAVTPEDESVRQRLSQKFPSVLILGSQEEKSEDPRLVETRVFRLRSQGVHAARGSLIVLTEDHIITNPLWLQSIRKAHEVEHRVVGGPVDPGETAGIYVWALYLCEYVQLIRPMPAGPAGYVSGVNASYRRESLQQCQDVWREAFFENEVNDALQAQAHQLWLAPDAWIESELLFPFKKARSHLQTGGWRFGCYRREKSRAAELLKWRLTLPLVPLFHLWRITKVMVTRRPRCLTKLLLGFPVVLTLVLAWSWGEARGLLGSGKTSDFGPQETGQVS